MRLVLGIEFVAEGRPGAVPRERPQVGLQFAASLARADSQPSLATPLQSARPARHVKPQTPLPHVGAAKGTFGHERKHPPQLSRSLCVDVSQPSAAMPLQLPQPDAQLPRVHAPPVHARAACGAVHALPQVPQCAASESASTSQPFAALPSQSR